MPSPPPDQSEHRAWLLSHVGDLGAARLVLDVGCGTGIDLAELAGHAGPDTRLVGIDSWPAQLEAARERCSGDPRVSFTQLDVDSGPLPFDDRAVDVVYSKELLECLADPFRLAEEIARVLRPGGQVVCGHWDWDSQTIDIDDKALARRVVHAFADFQQDWMRHVDSWMGRRLWRVFQRSGCFEGEVCARTLVNTTYASPWYGHVMIADLRRLVDHGALSAADHEQLLREVEAAAREGRYFYSVTGYAFVGRRRA